MEQVVEGAKNRPLMALTGESGPTCEHTLLVPTPIEAGEDKLIAVAARFELTQ